MVRVSTRARLIVALLLTVACLAAAGARGTNPKNASGCTSIRNTYYNNGYCDGGSGGCYYCEYSDRYGTYGCYEAPNPADGIQCAPLDPGGGSGGGGGGGGMVDCVAHPEDPICRDLYPPVM
jgi:hypothetical protein